MDTLDGLKQPSRFKVAKVVFENESFSRESVRDSIGDDVSYYKDCDTTELNESIEHSDTYHSGHSNAYDTFNAKSYRHYTREALPRLDHYRNVHSLHAHFPRPTLDELHNGNATLTSDSKFPDRKLSKAENEVPSKGAVKFGWIQGVLIRCLLNIWGVMLFLRLSWVVGQAGIGLACIIILLATMVTILTTLSMSAICTNGEVKGGGTYYMISRSLGPEFGGSIGFIFAVANAVAVAMYVVGFAETLRDLLKIHGIQIVDSDINNIRIISCSTIVFILAIAIVGTEWETKAQIFLLIILLAAMVDFLIGSVLTPNTTQISQGFIGWNSKLALENLGPDFRGDENFFSIFSVFFPAATGILAGANISGDLKDPQKAIPKGTLLSIFLTTGSYILFAVTAGATVYRDANGIEELLINNTLNIPTEALVRNCTITHGCKYGLMNHYQVMEMVSAFGPVIYAGIFAATLSSALASLVSAPKVFQALCNDKLFPGIYFFAKGYGKNNEPRRGYLLAFFIGLGCCAIGDLNHIAPLISNFFLAAYCLINLSCFHASLVKSTGFRPAFKYYNMWLSFAGFLLCLIVMFIINWITALATFAVCLMLYLCIYHRKPDVNWGSSTQAQTYSLALNAIIKLNEVPDHVKNYRPQILVLSGHPGSRPPLVDFAYTITKKLSLMVCGDIVTKGPLTYKMRMVSTSQAHSYLHKHNVKAFYSLVEEKNFSAGVSTLSQLVGVGKLRPNILLMGFKGNWQNCNYDDVVDYFNAIHDALDRHMPLGILRVPEGLDYSKYQNMDELVAPTRKSKNTSDNGFPEIKREPSYEFAFTRNVSCSQLSQMTNGSSRESSPPSTPCTGGRVVVNGGISQNPTGHASRLSLSKEVIDETKVTIPKEVLISANQFRRKQKKGYIDVWWLYDDGGLTMLIPHLLTTRSHWAGCKLRIFALANKKDELDREQRNMAALLSKFRIDFSNVTVIPDIRKPPQESSKQEFEALISKWRTQDKSEEKEMPLITEAEILALKDKTNRHIRLHELLCEHSKNAVLVVMTLPMPRKNTCSAHLYMAWLETLTKGMPPFLLIRGNQTSVLTFYS